MHSNVLTTSLELGPHRCTDLQSLSECMVHECRGGEGTDPVCRGSRARDCDLGDVPILGLYLFSDVIHDIAVLLFIQQLITGNLRGKRFLLVSQRAAESRATASRATESKATGSRATQSRQLLQSIHKARAGQRWCLQ